jgi:hypothetical protein
VPSGGLSVHPWTRAAARRKERPLMGKHTQEAGRLSTPTWETFEGWT